MGGAFFFFFFFSLRAFGRVRKGSRAMPWSADPGPSASHAPEEARHRHSRLQCCLLALVYAFCARLRGILSRSLLLFLLLQLVVVGALSILLTLRHAV